MSTIEIISEIIREKLYNKLYYELPYVIEQENVTFGELPDGTVRIDQLLFVPKEGQKVCCFYFYSLIYVRLFF